jgi:predicted glycosyltransferase involved in capsule biosynthesis
MGDSFFGNKSSFIKIGMQNEYFSGWGGEDNEIMLRADLFNLKHYRINDVLYHLYHKKEIKKGAKKFQTRRKDPATSK